MEPPMEPDVPSRELVRRARLFWEQSEADLKSAWQRWKAKAYLDSSFLSLQAALNALSTVCYLNGQVRIPNFSAVQLGSLCRELDPRFAAVEEACRELETVQGKNPYAPEAPETERAHSRLCYRQSDAILREVRGYLKSNRQRYFAP
jgi:HEPN domain-containing protein